MHLFFFHLFTDIDTLTPIIKLIGKEKTIISNLNILNNHSNQSLIKYLKSEKFNFEDYYFLNYRGYIFILIIKILNIFPLIILNKLSFFYQYIYYKLNSLSSRKLINFLKRKKISTVTIDNGLPEIYQSKIIEVCQSLDIKIITVRVGFDLFKNSEEKRYNTKNIITSSNFDNLKSTYNHNKFNFYNFIYLRFSKFWLDELSKINSKYKNKSILIDKSNKLKVLIFTRPRKNLFNENNSLILKLKNNKNFNTFVKIKPRSIELKKQNINSLSFHSSELIDWCDVIVSHSSSIIVEALIKKKPVFFPDYLKINSEEYVIKDYNCINLIKSEQQMIKELTKISHNKLIIKNYNFDSSLYLSKAIGDYKSWKSIENQYNLIYK